ncbi:hypothetical protein V1508DRAFT_278791 [Lipomyces doorenjongii]|uniref:uncharacterized protein n=1 Tax=Lipomyces doorenjongii TaxID=383834 RepID=UPI0034CDB8B8
MRANSASRSDDTPRSSLHKTRKRCPIKLTSDRRITNVDANSFKRRRNRQSRHGESGFAKKEPSRVLAQNSLLLVDERLGWICGINRHEGVPSEYSCTALSLLTFLRFLTDRAFLLRNLDLASPKEQEFTVTLIMNADAESVNLRRTRVPGHGEGSMTAKLRAVRAPWPWRRVGGAREVKFEGVSVGTRGISGELWYHWADD